jgi:ABC-type Fe3+-hydroxamate transport system substrate-binding protein
MLWRLPRIGGTKNPDIARILDLKPDLVFANEEENRLEDVQILREQGIDVDVTLPKKIADVPAAIRQWGARLAGESQVEADALAARVATEHDAVAAEPPPAPFRYAYWIWKDPWMTVSDDTYVADLMRLAGGVNAFGGEAARYPTTTPEQARVRGVDLHIFPSEPYPFRPEKHQPLAETLFGREGILLFVAGDDYCWHGVRTLEGLQRVRELRVRCTAGT